ncbi:hypothetical protein CDAR_420521 [Caerostris darwini]|uniref:Uncharacterized protein n=1 Tax=Caerostris darwini TaxID=1538125 RepID=A0AAV4P2T9_9ARAC|nr:hypothetical protein CDAR_420521 [Caerostris darwini]
MASSDSDARYHENCVNVDPNNDLSDRSDAAKDDTESYDDYLGIPENLPDFSGLMKNKEIAQLLTQYSEQQNKPEENQEIFALENMSDQDLTSTKTRFLAGGGIVPYDSGFEQPTDQTALPQTSDSYEPIDCDSENEKEEPKKPILIGYIGVTPLVNVSVEGL